MAVYYSCSIITAFLGAAYIVFILRPLYGHMFWKYVYIYIYMIIENPSGVTAGSRMVGTPIILVQRPINPGPIKDLWIMPLRPKTSEMTKEQERKVELPGIEPRATGIPCH